MANGKLRRGRPSVYQYPCHSRDAVFNSASPYRNSVAVEGRRGVLELQRAQMWGTGARSWGEELGAKSVAWQCPMPSQGRQNTRTSALRAYRGGMHGPQSSRLPQPSAEEPQLAPRLSHVAGVHFGGGMTPMHAPRSRSI